MGSTFSRLNHSEIIQRLNDKLLLILRTQRLFCIYIFRLIIILTFLDSKLFFNLSDIKRRHLYAILIQNVGFDFLICNISDNCTQLTNQSSCKCFCKRSNFICMKFCRKFFAIFTLYFIRNLPILYNSNRYYCISVIFCSVFKNFLKGQFWMSI